MCDICQDTGYITETFESFCDGGIIPFYIEHNCACNPAPTDEEADDSQDWAYEPRGSAYDDFHPFNAARYEGV